MASAVGYLLTICPKFTSGLSMIGSSMIISQVLRSPKNRENIQQRLICAMSIVDLMVSTVWFCTNLFIPPVFKTNMGFPWASGNQASCNAQGFLVQSSIAAVLYHATLSTYYVLVIKYNWKDTRLAKIEKYLHIIPLSFGIVTATIALSLGLMNPADWDCWIAPDPDLSNEVLTHALQWAFFFGPLWAAILFSSFNMFQIYRFVRQTETKSDKWKNKNERLARTKSVATQNKLYAAAFMLTWLFPTIARFIQMCGGTVPSWIVVLSGTFIPSQGFFNSLVYFRLRIKKCGQDHPGKSWLWLVNRIMILTIFPCCTSDRHNVVDGRDVEDDLKDIVTSVSSTRISTGDIYVENSTNEVPSMELSKRRKQGAGGEKVSTNRMSLKVSMRASWRTLKRMGKKVVKQKPPQSQPAPFQFHTKNEVDKAKELEAVKDKSPGSKSVSFQFYAKNEVDKAQAVNDEENIVDKAQEVNDEENIDMKNQSIELEAAQKEDFLLNSQDAQDGGLFVDPEQQVDKAKEVKDEEDSDMKNQSFELEAVQKEDLERFP